APCQMAGLRLFLGKNDKNLILVDFICLGINSPKVFHKHLQSLEQLYGAKAVSVQGKNKDLGWRSLAYKIRFANDSIYLREGKDDAFTRGFVSLHINCRPACYECKYKGFPRISDITLGDFWGIEKVDKTMDDNMGTSVVLLNSQKGMDFFHSMEDKVHFTEKNMADVFPGNKALQISIEKPSINRDEFYADVDKLDFADVVKKYFPPSINIFQKVKNKLAIFEDLASQMGCSPKAYLQFLRINFFRKNTQCDALHVNLFYPTRYTVLNIHKSAVLSINGSLLLGHKRIKGSRLETRFAIEEGGSLILEKGFVSIFYGTDILVFKGASLKLNGQMTINQNVQIICMDSITIGEDVMISRDVVIRDNDGGHEILSAGYKKTAPVVIGNHVWIGQGVMIMKGVTIGNGAIISAGAWVSTNVKPNALVMGDPARAVQKNVEWRH
ncbi:MAG: Coenzyme F420 hydrogenase/dehydrogenase, beta subunit C-terminal domain, partial [Bacteroidales bacterium]|nr:Coenzyme F420 hydrogenase/dehydrogenase, beta subunit C-terminal domain [Bacteroidales bacterium]